MIFELNYSGRCTTPPELVLVQVGKLVHPHVSIVGDAKDSLNLLNKKLMPKTAQDRAEWLGKVRHRIYKSEANFFEQYVSHETDVHSEQSKQIGVSAVFAQFGHITEHTLCILIQLGGILIQLAGRSRLGRLSDHSHSHQTSLVS